MATLCSIACLFFLAQETQEPFPEADAIREQLKEEGVLVGKGGVSGNVRNHKSNVLFYAYTSQDATLLFWSAHTCFLHHAIQYAPSRQEHHHTCVLLK